MYLFSFVSSLLCLGSVEVNLPVDSFTKKIKGFAHVKLKPPEVAVKALSELDGSVFQVCWMFIFQYVTSAQVNSAWPSPTKE